MDGAAACSPYNHSIVTSVICLFLLSKSDELIATAIGHTDKFTIGQTFQQIKLVH